MVCLLILLIILLAICSVPEKKTVVEVKVNLLENISLTFPKLNMCGLVTAYNNINIGSGDGLFVVSC